MECVSSRPVCTITNLHGVALLPDGSLDGLDVVVQTVNLHISQLHRLLGAAPGRLGLRYPLLKCPKMMR